MDNIQQINRNLYRDYKKYTNELLSLSFKKCKFRGLYSNSTIYISRNDEKETWMKT